MASSFMFGAAAVKPNDSFIPQLKKTPYGPILDQRLSYGVFVHKTTFLGNFHHRIVLCDKGAKYGYITLELGKTPTALNVAPLCQEYHGDTDDLEFKGTVEATMRELADVAINILREMGDYGLFGNNCQNFCNKFLERVNLVEGQYWTTPQKVGAGVAVAAGVVLLGAFAASFFKDSCKKEDQ